MEIKLSKVGKSLIKTDPYTYITANRRIYKVLLEEITQDMSTIVTYNGTVINKSDITSIKGNNGCKLKSIAEKAFQKCDKLESLHVNSLTTIGFAAFQRCTKLSSIHCQNVTSIGGYAFDRCAFSTIDCRNATYFDEYAFNRCDNLYSVDCRNLKNTITTGLFRYCTSLKEINLSNLSSLVSYHDYSFQSCSNVSIYLRDSDMCDMFSNDTSWKTLVDDNVVSFIPIT